MADNNQKNNPSQNDQGKQNPPRDRQQQQGQRGWQYRDKPQNSDDDESM